MFNSYILSENKDCIITIMLNTIFVSFKDATKLKKKIKRKPTRDHFKGSWSQYQKILTRYIYFFCVFGCDDKEKLIMCLWDLHGDCKRRDGQRLGWMRDWDLGLYHVGRMFFCIFCFCFSFLIICWLWEIKKIKRMASMWKIEALEMWYIYVKP